MRFNLYAVKVCVGVLLLNLFLSYQVSYAQDTTSLDDPSFRRGYEKARSQFSDAAQQKDVIITQLQEQLDALQLQLQQSSTQLQLLQQHSDLESMRNDEILKVIVSLISSNEGFISSLKSNVDTDDNTNNQVFIAKLQAINAHLLQLTTYANQ